MAAYNRIMTLLHATDLERTDSAKPVIFSEGLVVLAQILHVLRFWLLTKGPQQSTRMARRLSTSVCCCLCYAPFLVFLPQTVLQHLRSLLVRLLCSGSCVQRAAFLLIHVDFLSCPGQSLMESTVLCQCY